MVFSSAVFLFVFFPVFFLLERAAPTVKVKNGLLILASLIFYSFGQPQYISILLCSVILNYGCGLLAEGKYRKFGVILAVTGNLALLGCFKYTDFIFETINSLFGLSLPLSNIVLPIGISFFTFQGMSYVIDVYREKSAASRSFFKVLLYVSFFPQLIAGPIILYQDMEKALGSRSVNNREAAYGLRRFIAGLSKKLLIADAMAVIVNAVFLLPVYEVGQLSAWLGAICYALQIYFDFSGYSDMAIGLAAMFGFRFDENFNYPYTATTMKDFWGRWHISLSVWFRDYVYIPLGGNRKGEKRTWINRFIVFFLTGLWHGANWTFVLWGLWHGVFSVMEDAGIVPVKKLQNCGLGRVYTLLIVGIGFVLFRADTISQAIGLLGKMLFGFGASGSGDLTVFGAVTPLFVLLFALAIALVHPLCKKFKKRHETLGFIGALALLLLCVMNIATQSFSPFIYFQF